MPALRAIHCFSKYLIKLSLFGFDTLMILFLCSTVKTMLFNFSVQYLNSWHVNIKITIECEENNVVFTQNGTRSNLENTK